MGVTLRGPEATRTVAGGTVHLIRIGDISQDGGWENREFVRIEPREKIRDDLCLRPGDVLFPNRGTRTTAICFRLDLPKAIAGAQLFVLRPDPAVVDPEYLAWTLRTEESANYFKSRRKGSYVQIIQRQDLADFEIPLPPLWVQKLVAEVAGLASEERVKSVKLAELTAKLRQAELLDVARNLQIHVKDGES
ncbi:MAG: hypothetical protein V1929_08455 [bacterium]